MDLKEFIENLITVFEDANPSTIKPSTILREIEGYSSFSALSIIAMVDEKYKVKIKGDDLRKATTIEELFNILNLKT